MLKCDDVVEAFVRLTEQTEPTVNYRRSVAVSMVAACLERKCWLQWGFEKIYPNLYIVLIGPSGLSRKGTAIRLGKPLLEAVGVNISCEQPTRQALIDQLRGFGAVDVNCPTDISVHTSMTILSEEFTNFLGYQNKEMMDFLDECYDCPDRFGYRTIRRGEEYIYNVWINLLGAMTPDHLQETIPRSMVGGGFVSRFIFVYEMRKGKAVPYHEITATELQLMKDITDDLKRIRSEFRGEFAKTDDFIKAFSSWYVLSENSPPFRDPNLGGYIGRRATTVKKLSMIMNASRGGGMKLEVRDLEKALDYLESVEVNMPLLYRRFGAHKFIDAQIRMKAMIKDRGIVPMAEVVSAFENELLQDDMSRIIRGLELSGFCVCYHDGKSWYVKYLGR